MKKVILFISSLLLLVSCGQNESVEINYDVIPLPQKTELSSGTPFKLSSSTQIVYTQGNDKLKRVANFLSEYILYSTGMTLTVVDDANKKESDVISIKADMKHENTDAYTLTVDDKGVVITGASEAGAFYGVQTLRKSIGVEGMNKDILLPQVKIEDYPRFQYRGMMLDVARHMFPVDFIKEYIDIMALHNINKLHWHITDDQGWRIEIKKHPKLTELGSIRKETVIGRNSGKFDGKEYGGFYTQEQVKEIVAYADERFITVIPEVDLPGHMLGALKAYPHLGCTGGPYEVGNQWGVFDDVLCAGNDEILTFLEDVLTEVVDLFPSKYVHIGGDECPKVRWKECPKCQAKIKSLGLKADKEHSAEERLQSHIITHVEKFLNGKGRQIIGWDEILEGGLAPNATVMSWRSMEGGTIAAKQGNDVIMTPTSFLYFDYYQTADIENVPLSIGGYVPIEKVYSFDPIPSKLTPEEAKHIIGVQANLWTEYIPTTKQVEYMVLPRMDALAEVQWTMPEKKDYANFTQRLLKMVAFYSKKGYNYSPTVFDVQPKIVTNTEKGVIELSLSTIDNAPVYYTLDGSEPTENSQLYSSMLSFSEPTTIKATAIRQNIKTPVFKKEFNINKATMKPITLKPEPRGTYAYGGALSLVDGISGNRGGYKDGTWIGFNDGDLEAIIDLKEATEISKLGFSTYVCTGDWIFGAKGVDIEGSMDGKTYKPITSKKFEEAKEYIEEVVDVAVDFEPTQTRYVKVTIHKTLAIPSWHSGKGFPAYIFVDEIRID